MNLPTDMASVIADYLKVESVEVRAEKAVAKIKKDTILRFENKYYEYNKKYYQSKYQTSLTHREDICGILEDLADNVEQVLNGKSITLPIPTYFEYNNYDRDIDIEKYCDYDTRVLKLVLEEFKADYDFRYWSVGVMKQEAKFRCGYFIEKCFGVKTIHEVSIELHKWCEDYNRDKLYYIGSITTNTQLMNNLEKYPAWSKLYPYHSYLINKIELYSNTKEYQENSWNEIYVKVIQNGNISPLISIGIKKIEVQETMFWSADIDYENSEVELEECDDNYNSYNDAWKLNLTTIQKWEYIRNNVLNKKTKMPNDIPNEEFVKFCGKCVVAGGGLQNGNAYAVVYWKPKRSGNVGYNYYIENGCWRYAEYGENPKDYDLGKEFIQLNYKGEETAFRFY